MDPKTKNDADQQDQDKDEGASILQKDQHAFVDEQSPRGKQFGEGRKVADLNHVGAIAPDSDSDELPKQPAAKR